MKMSRYTGHITDAEIYRNSVWKWLHVAVGSHRMHVRSALCTAVNTHRLRLVCV